MNRGYLSFLFIVFSFFWSCKNKDEIAPDAPKHFVLSAYGETDYPSIQLAWKVDGKADGYKYINCDLYLSDTALMTTNKLAILIDNPDADVLNKWVNSPVLCADVGKENSSQTIQISDYMKRTHLSGFRSYLGVAVNGFGPTPGTLPSDVKIEYTITVKNSKQEEIITGSFQYNTALQNQTFVKYIYSVDWGTYEAYNYSFRELKSEVTIIRNSDFEYTNELDFSSGLNYFITESFWNVEGNYPGYNYVDLDLNLWDQLGTTFNYSSTSSYYDEFWQAINSSNYSTILGFTYYGNNNISNLPTPFMVNGKLVLYNWMNPFKRYIMPFSFSSMDLTPDPEIGHGLLRLNRSGNKMIITVY